MKRLKFIAMMLVTAVILSGCVGCTNPAVPAGKVAYVVNNPTMFGEKGEFLKIMIGPTSYGLGWANDIASSVDYRPKTIKEQFTPVGGAGPDAKQDTRIMSVDEINMEVTVSVVLGYKNAPSGKEYNEGKFTTHMKNYFENYVGAWPRVYKEPFRTKCRNLLRKFSYSSAKAARDSLSGVLFGYLAKEMEKSPFKVIAVNISNINPPLRMLQEQEKNKATEIAEKRQKKEEKLQKSKKDVMAQEARNLAAALRIAPKYLKNKELEIQDKYADGFKIMITGEEAKSIGKILVVPYGQPVSLPVQ